MDLYRKLVQKETKLCVIGMGYVGLPIALSFSRCLSVIGFDINKERIDGLKSGIDRTGEVECEKLQTSNIAFTVDENCLEEADFFIVAVPTPIDQSHLPDLTPLKQASETIARHMKIGSVVVYESTVYPGLTEEVCVPILEDGSGLVYQEEFFVGYSPERINPGDMYHRLETIVKVVSGCNEETRELIAQVYELVVKAGVYKAESIKVAEAAKVIENSQRDINIAFMNELSIIFHKIGIDTTSVLDAASTKWNFLHFRPGLVGGHCIGVDPYYLTYQAQRLGYQPEVILSGRRINDNMGQYLAQCAVKNLIECDVKLHSARIGIFGFTFKENCPDIRNTKVFDIVTELQEYSVQPVIVDPVADVSQAKALYGIEILDFKEVPKESLDGIIVAVCHEAFREYTMEFWDGFYKRNLSRRFFADVKGMYNADTFTSAGYLYWRL